MHLLHFKDRGERGRDVKCEKRRLVALVNIGLGCEDRQGTKGGQDICTQPTRFRRFKDKSKSKTWSHIYDNGNAICEENLSRL